MCVQETGQRFLRKGSVHRLPCMDRGKVDRGSILIIMVVGACSGGGVDAGT